MSSTLAAVQPPPLPRYRDVVLPKEHGSWSLALEPVAFGLLAAPTLGGGALAIAAIAGFFARRPLRLGITESNPDRRDVARRATVACGFVALTAWFGALAAAGGTQWLGWLIPTAAAGAIFLYFDLQKAGREQQAEVAGAFAFASLPAAFAALAGWSWQASAALGLVMIARAVPTVLTVRGTIRARKTGRSAPALPVIAGFAALAIVAVLARAGLAPWTAVVLAGVLAARSFGLLVYPRPQFRASTIGIIEAAFGTVYVLAVALAWRL